MHSNYNFDFLKTISEQLVTALDKLPVSPLNAGSLARLTADQATGGRQGVYVIHLAGQPVYIGKADDVAARLAEHLKKMSGRENIVLEQVGYKALLLDDSMGTAANEGLLIKIYRRNHPTLWNGRGFGPKDPGKERDTTKPGFFDAKYPIRDNAPVAGVNDTETVGELLSKMKAGLPFVFRYDLSPDPELAHRPLSLAGVPRDAKCLLQAAVTELGMDWKGAVLSFGMVLYKTSRDYPYGVEILP